MIIVQETVVCKPGNASKMAKMFKELMAGKKEFVNVMTDMTGQYNRVIMVTRFDSLAHYETSWKEMEKNPEEMKKMQELMKDYKEMYQTGSREIYQVW